MLQNIWKLVEKYINYVHKYFWIGNYSTERKWLFYQKQKQNKNKKKNKSYNFILIARNQHRMSQKTYQRSKLLIQVNNITKTENWLSSLPMRIPYSKLILGLKLLFSFWFVFFFFLSTDFQKFCCTYYDKFSAKYCWENILPPSK